MIYSQEEICGIELEEGIVCAECWTDEEFDDLEQNQIITEKDIEHASDSLYFCDRCNKRL